MIILGITGGVGAGKSTILSYLKEQYGARILMADQVAFDLEQPGQECFDEIVRTFGETILNEKGEMDRKKVASIVFQDPEKLETLNGIVHPAVRTWIEKEIEKERAGGQLSMLVIEAALLLEAGYREICDDVWYIYTDPAVRKRRLMASRGYTSEKVDQIMANQLPDTEYRKKCKIVIDNSSDFVENTYEQIDRFLSIQFGTHKEEQAAAVPLSDSLKQ